LPVNKLHRGSGVALWRQIADQIRVGLDSALADDTGRLPPETALAARYAVNRHTVRSAISALVQEGVLESRQGSGTFVKRQRRLKYPIGQRTRFSAGLEGQTRERGGRLLKHGSEPAPRRVADALGIAPGSPVIRLETLGMADGVPVTRAISWFDASRFAGIAEKFAEHASVTIALGELGVQDYLRASTAIDARHASEEDMADLELSPGAIVLLTRAVNTDVDKRPIQYSETRFAADRVELTVTP
jgi:GntR family phosphonate transport system transcriptional regulator